MKGTAAHGSFGISMPKYLLTYPQLDDGRRFVDEAGANTLRKARTLANSGTISGLEGHDGFFSARVRGGEVYEVDLEFDGTWFGTCTCPVGEDCKHCLAVMMVLLHFAQPVSSEPPKPKAKSSTKAATAKKEPKKPRAKSAFTSEVETRLQREVTAEETVHLRIVEKLFEKFREARQVTENEFSELWGYRQTWSWQSHVLWQDPPQSPWETWLYLLHFMRGHKKRPPEFLEDITAPGEVEGLVAEWQWRDAVRSWTDELSTPRALIEAGGPVDLRVIFHTEAAELEIREGDGPWVPLKKTRYSALGHHYASGSPFTAEGSLIWWTHKQGDPGAPVVRYDDPRGHRGLSLLLQNKLFAERVLTAAGEPFHRPETPLRWALKPAESERDHYRFTLRLPDGSPPPPNLFVVDGNPGLYVTPDTIYPVLPVGRLGVAKAVTARIPAPAFETAGGVALLAAADVPVPPRLSTRVTQRVAKLVIKASLNDAIVPDSDTLYVEFLADWGPGYPSERWTSQGWKVAPGKPAPKGDGQILLLERKALDQVWRLPGALGLESDSYQGHWWKRVTKKFPAEFAEWLLQLPKDAELRLDPVLASLRDDPLHANVKLDVEPAGVDWFDLRVTLDLPEIEFTPDELEALLKAKGGWVRLGAKGWRRLALQLTDEDDAALADLGLSPADLLSEERQRLHALQLAHAGADNFLTADRVAELRQRATELKARVAPPVPATVTAELRPYQVEGFHFLAYLTANRFGGLLADDMGLGKTLQTLTWLVWLREQPDAPRGPSLVICPKSVMDNWTTETARFAPHLRVKLWSRGTTGSIADAAREHDLLVLNYTQLRLLEAEVSAVEWLAVILDEAQAIKNPDSQTTRAACGLRAAQRLALTGTPIENRLLDLWSIMSFTMPGMLGPRARFARTYDQKDDPFARRRLAARTRPFLIRRTKEQVARDLPPRVEEELLCEMEGKQSTLYRAELKRARQELLKLKTSRDLDKARFNILTSLLRLRQICCHPGLVDAASIEQPSAKLEALLDLLEPLMEEGRKVLVFSQFVGVLEILQKAIEARGWPQFLLTGQTEDRGDLIAEFQLAPGAAVFLLSLKASGFGLNLTAASYVVLYDPWWNPAVENQAIDRTHRIGQKSTVFAYRLLIKGSIEEKIRALQKQKRALAEDILGEESFSRALTLDDLHALLSE